MDKNNEKLRIIKKLPQIILPANKNEMFINWYNEDLRFQDEIPKVFERGYIFLTNDFNINSINKNQIFKYMAKHFNTTYREIENYFYKFIEKTKNFIVYFEFENNWFKTKFYSENELISKSEIDLNAKDITKPNPRVEEAIEMMASDINVDFTDLYTYYSLILVRCCLWYIATARKPVKYYREEKQLPFYHEKKEVINPKKNITINTPIYDMNKIRKVKVEGLIKRRKGWTYSHSFQVHGHYRHYADGKVIFVNSYIKGKGKEQIAQVIKLNPKEEN